MRIEPLDPNAPSGKPNGHWHCPDPYAKEMAPLREGGRAFLAAVSAALGALLATGDAAPLKRFLADLWKAAAGLATDEDARASWRTIDDDLQAFAAVHRERADQGRQRKRDLTMARAQTAIEIVERAMKGGLSEEAAFRLLDRAALPLWRVGIDEGEEVVYAPEAGPTVMDQVKPFIDQVLAPVHGRVRVAQVGVPLEPIGHHHHAQAWPMPPAGGYVATAPDQAAALVLKLASLGAIAYDGAPKVEGSLPPPIIHPDVWGKVAGLIEQLGTPIAVVNGEHGDGEAVAGAGLDPHDVEMFGEIAPAVANLRRHVASGVLTPPETAKSILMGLDVMRKAAQRGQPMPPAVATFLNGSYELAIEALLPDASGSFRQIVAHEIRQALAGTVGVAPGSSGGAP